MNPTRTPATPTPTTPNLQRLAPATNTANIAETTTVKAGWSVEMDAPIEPLKLSQNRNQVPLSTIRRYVAMPQIVSPFVAVRA